MAQLVGLHADVNNGDRLLGIDEVLVHGTEEAVEDAGVLHLLPFHAWLVVDGYEVVIPKSPDLEGRDVGKADVPRFHSSVGDSLVVDGQVGLVEESFLQERPEQHDAARSCVCGGCRRRHRRRGCFPKTAAASARENDIS